MRIPHTGIVLTAALLLFGSCHRVSRYEKIAREARELTRKQCPFDVDPYTRLDSFTFDASTLRYYYNYTVWGMLDNDSIFTPEACERFRRQTIDEIRSSIQLLGYKEAGLTLVYRYYSTSEPGHLIAEFPFTKEDYGE